MYVEGPPPYASPEQTTQDQYQGTLETAGDKGQRMIKVTKVNESNKCMKKVIRRNLLSNEFQCFLHYSLNRQHPLGQAIGTCTSIDVLNASVGHWTFRPNLITLPLKVPIIAVMCLIFSYCHNYMILLYTTLLNSNWEKFYLTLVLYKQYYILHMHIRLSMSWVRDTPIKTLWLMEVWYPFRSYNCCDFSCGLHKWANHYSVYVQNENECKKIEICAHSSLSESQMHKIFFFFSWAWLKVRK